VVHPFLRHQGPVPYVHRGGPVGTVENTMAAFGRAHAMGFRYFETDVHATSDGVLVAFHDRTLRRVAGERSAIETMSASEVRAVRLGGERIPFLADLIGAFPDVRFNIDPKHDAAARPLATLLRDLGVLERVCVASFSDRRLSYLRVALGEEVCTAAGPREVARTRAAASTGRSVQLVADVLQVPRGAGPLSLVNRAFVDTAHAAQVPVHVWTVNEERTMRQLLDLGVDGLMSDDPDLLRRVLMDRGDWSTRTDL
jgi:glycerophosphoryl diester phosphodiesterase